MIETNHLIRENDRLYMYIYYSKDPVFKKMSKFLTALISDKDNWVAKYTIYFNELK